MTSLYQSPLRVYLALGALALWGIVCGFQLPISLFPNSSKPTISVEMSYGDMSATEFLNTYGRQLETNLQNISVEGTEVEKIKATYTSGVAEYRVLFKWGSDARKALREAQNVTSAFVAPLPLEIRNSVNVDHWSESSGFIAVSFYSPKRSLDELYKMLEPQLVPPIRRIRDAMSGDLWNPNKKEIRIELNPEKTAMLGIFPRDVAAAVVPQLGALRGGSVIEGFGQLDIQMPAIVKNVEDLNRAVIPTRSGKAIHLSDIAHIDLGTPTSNTRAVKTSGVPSLILFAMPRAGGNVKRMAEDVLEVVEQAKKNFPPDVEYKVLVDPSEFIRSAVTNVVHEVVVAALLAVFVLFLFIGNFRNVITAAIEIPLSIVLAFIMMRLTGINLNLISLGGLALSAGMNVDGSVVVMENIFRHFDEVDGEISFKDRVRILSEAVAEVRFPIIASTIASLVVFIPLAFTSQLTNAILGDLAMAVVFSHGFSAVVALILVPTVRLQLMKGRREKTSHSFLEPYLVRLENFYGRCLAQFLQAAKLRSIVYISLAVTLIGLMIGVLPRLPREIIGKPDTDWIILVVNTKGNSLIHQMESVSDTIEARLLNKFESRIRYTFTQVTNPNQTQIMARLKDKKDMLPIWKEFETEFANTPELQFMVIPWNPSELDIPNPPNLWVTVRGSDAADRVQVGRELHEKLIESKLYPRLWTEPDLAVTDTTDLVASPEQWTLLAGARGALAPADLADISRTATLGRRIWQMPIDGAIVPIQLAYPNQRVASIADLESLPVGVNGKLIPLKALADVRRHPANPDSYRENNTDLIRFSGRVSKGSESELPTLTKKSTALIEEWKKENQDKHSSIVTIVDADQELNEALSQLTVAIALSVILIFITMIFQFGDIVNSALVLVAIPLGFIGVLISLFVFQSTLSLNSVLGIILLNGIAVANSIILVDFLKRLVDKGRTPSEAAVEAATKRLRPILMTSMTTGLGMLPVALGFGEGGRILQPLGIAVVGGLAFSMLTTLMIVPSLQVSYLNWKRRRVQKRAISQPSVQTFICLAILCSFVFAHADENEISFSKALNEMIETNVEVKVQQTNVSASESKVWAARGAFFPTVSLQAQRQQSGGNYNLTGALTEGQIYSVVANWNVFRSGSDLASLTASLSNRDYQRLLYDDAHLQAEDKAATALLSLIQDKMRIEVLKRAEVNAQKFIEIAESRYEKSLLAKEEKDKIAIDANNAEARRADAELKFNTSRASVESLLGHSKVKLEWPWEKRLSLEELKGEMSAGLKTALDSRPDYRAARTTFDAEDAKSRAQFRNLLPTIDISFTQSALQMPSQSFNAWQGMATLTVPLWNGYKDYSAYRVQAEAKSAAEYRMRQMERDIDGTVRSSQDNFKLAVQQYQSRLKNLTTAKHLLDQDVARFKIGRVDANELNLDLARVTDAELLAIAGIQQAHLAFMQLQHAFGRRVP